jgi:hypothetical protein
MALSKIRARGPHLESVTNLTLAQVTLEALLTPRCKAEDALQWARDERKEELDLDPLGSARGIVNGLRLSLTLWSFVTLVVLLTR